MLEVKLLKIFSKLNEGEMPNAVISYRRTAWELAVVGLNERANSYKCYVYINLWIVILDFSWIKKNN